MAERQPPVLCAAVLAYGDRTQHLSVVLDALKRDGFERVVVVANAVSSSTNELLSRWLDHADIQLEIVESKTNLGSAGGFAAALRQAFSMPGCHATWLLDDDNLPSLGSYDKLLARASSPGAPQMLWAAVRNGRPEFRPDQISQLQQTPWPGTCLGFHLLKALGFRRKGEVARPTGDLPYSVYGGLLVSREAVHKCGLPNTEMFLYADDLEWTCRMQRAGYAIQLLRDVEISDLDAPGDGSTEKTSLLKQRITRLDDLRAYFYVRNRNWFVRTYFPGAPVVYWTNRVVYSALMLAVALRYGRLKRFLLLMRALRDSELGRLGTCLPAV